MSKCRGCGCIEKSIEVAQGPDVQTQFGERTFPVDQERHGRDPDSSRTSGSISTDSLANEVCLTFHGLGMANDGGTSISQYENPVRLAMAKLIAMRWSL